MVQDTIIEQRSPLGSNSNAPPRSQIAAQNRARDEQEQQDICTPTPPRNNSTRFVVDSRGVNPQVLEEVQENLEATVVNRGSARRARNTNRCPDLLSAMEERRNGQNAAFLHVLRDSYFTMMNCTPEHYEKAETKLAEAKEKFKRTQDKQDKKAVTFYFTYLDKLLNCIS